MTDNDTTTPHLAIVAGNALSRARERAETAEAALAAAQQDARRLDWLVSNPYRVEIDRVDGEAFLSLGPAGYWSGPIRSCIDSARAAIDAAMSAGGPQA